MTDDPQVYEKNVTDPKFNKLLCSLLKNNQRFLKFQVSYGPVHGKRSVSQVVVRFNQFRAHVVKDGDLQHQDRGLKDVSEVNFRVFQWRVL